MSDLSTGTLYDILRQSPSETTYILCNTHTPFVLQHVRDSLYGCGYRNAQMMLKSYQHADVDVAKMSFDSIYDLQVLIEQAWRDGFDAQGAQQLAHKLVRSHKWIGATEVYTLLASLGLRVHLVDFPRNKRGDIGERVANWMVEYFGMDPKETSGVRLAQKEPLLLQHQGHSRTVVGVCRWREEISLLVFDPIRKVTRLSLELKSPKDVKNHCVVGLSSLRQHKEYQVVYLERGPRLSVTEKEAYKVVKSIRVE